MPLRTRHTWRSTLIFSSLDTIRFTDWLKSYLYTFVINSPATLAADSLIRMTVSVPRTTIFFSEFYESIFFLISGRLWPEKKWLWMLLHQIHNTFYPECSNWINIETRSISSYFKKKIFYVISTYLFRCCKDYSICASILESYWSLFEK